MIYLEKTDVHSTLTTWLYCTFWQMWAAELNIWDCYINWPTGKFLQSYEDKKKFAEIPNAYDWYFKQPKTNIIPLRDRTWTWETWVDNSHIPFMSQPLSVIKDYYKKHLIFNDETNKRGQSIVDKYRIDFTRTIGVTWRGTDIYLDGRPRIPIDKYFRFIDAILETNPDFRIMCTAEEKGILDPLLARYPNAFLIEEFYSVPYETKHNPERVSPMSGYERGLQPVLMVWLFSKCAYYIKNRSSTGAIASWLSDGKIYCIAHPENLGYEKMDTEYEFEGKRYPL